MKSIKEIFSNREIVNRIAFTVFALIIFRILSNIPLPGVDMLVYSEQFAGRSTSEAKYLLTVLTGGNLDSPSIVGLGIGVYITASIVVQLLSSAIPSWEQLSRDGTRGRYVLDRYTRFLTVPIGIVTSIGYLLLLTQQVLGINEDGSAQYLISRNPDGTISAAKIVFMTLILIAGSLFLMWLAELITEKGITNGASLMIMFGILGTLPAYLISDIQAIGPVGTLKEVLAGNFSALTQPSFVVFIVAILAMVALIFLIVMITESTRKVPIQYAQRQRTGYVHESYFPLKLNQTGVMPIIFASSLLALPQLLLPILSNIATPDSPLASFATSAQNSFLSDSNSTGYSLTYFVLIVMFSIFYIFVSFKPEQVAEDLQKSGAFVPGIRPGKSTEGYLTGIVIRLNVVGAIVLGVIALIPIVGGNLMFNYAQIQLAVLSAIGGTSILIVIGVLLEGLRQIKALRATQNYDRFV